jgi:hypothetical protein
LQRFATEGLEKVSNAVNVELDRFRGPTAEVVARQAVADLELVADHREEHRMCTKQQLPVDDGMEAKVDRNIGSSAAIPAGAMAGLG